MGKVAALVLTEEEKNVTQLAVSVASSIANPLRNPSSADSVGTFLVVVGSISFVLPLGAKAQSFRYSSSPHQTH